ncbi:hypothetical protein ENSA7_55060 [Enhygromyxa salina]|uniref:Uncharacterized protein n=2 Tax=Enhygromyxa salina TaxID=215803 RepID=A0A2S9YC41_9BACT|nr:hypothetical protein ENSA7_55060 [Enhygromyxa salina]
MFQGGLMSCAELTQCAWDANPFVPGAANPFMHPRAPGPWPASPGDSGWMPAPPPDADEWVFTPSGAEPELADHTPASARTELDTEVVVESSRIEGSLTLRRRADHMTLRMLGSDEQPPLELRSAMFSKTSATTVLFVDVVHEHREPGVYLAAVLDRQSGDHCGVLALTLGPIEAACV